MDSIASNNVVYYCIYFVGNFIFCQLLLSSVITIGRETIIIIILKLPEALSSTIDKKIISNPGCARTAVL